MFETQDRGFRDEVGYGTSTHPAARQLGLPTLQVDIRAEAGERVLRDTQSPPPFLEWCSPEVSLAISYRCSGTVTKPSERVLALLLYLRSPGKRFSASSVEELS